MEAKAWYWNFVFYVGQPNTLCKACCSKQAGSPAVMSSPRLAPGLLEEAKTLNLPANPTTPHSTSPLPAWLPSTWLFGYLYALSRRGQEGSNPNPTHHLAFDLDCHVVFNAITPHLLHSKYYKIVSKNN
jgi:hypothetical protein